MATDDMAEPMNWTEEFVKSPVITLIVGEQCPTWTRDEPCKLYAHEKHLVRIPFFEKMFTSGFRESQEKIVHMPEDDPKAVEFVLAFLYDGRVSFALDTAGFFKSDQGRKMGSRLAALWMYADKLQFANLQNELWSRL